MMNLPIRFTKVTIRNFMSFGNVPIEIDLNTIDSILINGWNEDTQSSNGAGKTTIINAICYAIYNKPHDNISLQRLINTTNASKNTLMEVTLTFLKGECEYEIYRCRGEQTNIKITIDGEPETRSSVMDNDRFIEEIIGISYDLFVKVVIFSNNGVPFLLQPISHQRSQIEELFCISILSEKATLLKKKILQTEIDIGIQNAIIKEQESANTIHKRHIKEAEARISNWELKQAASIKEIEDDLMEIEGIDFETEQELHSSKEELVKSVNRINMILSPLNSEVKNLTKELQKHQHELTHLEDAKCPFCLQSYEDAASKIVELKEKIKTKTEKLQTQETSILENRTVLEELKESLSIIKSEIKHENLKELLNIRTNSVLLNNKLTRLKSDTNPHLEAYESLLSESDKVISYDKLDELKTYLEHQQFLVKLLVDKNSFIRRRIINKTIPFLNRQLNQYTQIMGLPHIVKFSSDMSCVVTEYGRELDFGNLSNGEKKRVNLAMSLAFRDVLHHLHSTFNLLMLDEVDGGAICTAGMDSIVKLLKQKNRDDKMGIWMISHRPEAIGRFDRDILVLKERGFSSIHYTEKE